MFVFKSKYHEGIKKGTITETIRYWLHWKASRVQLGKVTYAYDLGYIRIDALEEITLADLTEEDAKNCGEPSLKDLKRQCLLVYGKLFPNKDLEHDKWYRVKFSYVFEEVPVNVHR